MLPTSDSEAGNCFAMAPSEPGKLGCVPRALSRAGTAGTRGRCAAISFAGISGSTLALAVLLEDFAIAGLAIGLVPLVNAIIRGALEIPQTQTTANTATIDAAASQPRPVPIGRFASRICATRSEVWRILPNAA